MSKRIRVVLAEDHALVREGTAELLERAGGVQVVGQAADGLEAVRLVQLLHPDVLVIDLAMPGLDGIEATRRARASSPRTAVLALTRGIGVFLIAVVVTWLLLAVLQNFGSGGFGSTPGCRSIDRASEVHSFSYAAYAQMTWNATDALHLTVGGRYTLIMKKFDEGWRIVHDHTSG